MIGGGAGGAARRILLLLSVALVLGFRSADAAPADPPAAAGRLAILRHAIASADAALAGLDAELRAAGEAGRRGSALAVAGETAPGPALLEAAAALDAISGPDAALASAEAASQRVAGTLAAVLPGAPALPGLAITPDELFGMAAQLRAAAPAGDAFAARRQQTEAAAAGLADAVAALDADAPATALGHLDDLDRVLTDLGGWSDAPGSFGTWLAVIGEFSAASRGLADASLAGDAIALEAASRRYATAAASARGADQALGLAISEGGAAVAATPLRRLADALDSLTALRSALGLVLYSMAG
ncbi:MAG TPA: hypothetical protein VJA85_07500 [Candidatus Limnocylindria bacterium]|nr:hypothetical protein [Candidatus Limnocylindria bacterium]